MIPEIRIVRNQTGSHDPDRLRKEPTMTTSLLNRLTSEGPKRILSLDGGGIRGIVSLGFLGRIEKILRERYENAELRLCDYFDLIGGTSTGAIIAACLAEGMEVADIKERYLRLGAKIFASRKWRRWRALFRAQPLEKELKSYFGNRTLGDTSIRTGLIIITKRVDTESTWPLLNHPRGKYYFSNKDILLCDALRASTAAPFFFEPKKFDVGSGETGVFLDGGVSMATNPSLQIFLSATLKGFPFHWPLGENRLLLVSVGTGIWHRKEDPVRALHGGFFKWLLRLPRLLSEDACWQNQLLLQYLSRTATPWHIDSEVGDLSEDLLIEKPLLRYLRYDVLLEEKALKCLGFPELVQNLPSLRRMTAARNEEDLLRIARKTAVDQVDEEHFPPEFDLPGNCRVPEAGS